MADRIVRIRRLERAAADALACRQVRHDDGWRLRYHDGLTRRCNAVFAEACGVDDLVEKVVRAEAFYRRRGAPPRFQLTEASRPRALPGVLRARGYRRSPGAWVETASLAAWTERPAEPGAPEGGTAYGGTAYGGDAALVVASAPTPTWLEALARGSDAGGGVERLLRSPLAYVRPPAAFASLVRDGATVAVGLGVRRGSALGLFHLATVPEARRRGHASQVIAALARWGREGGAVDAFLQVHPDNRNARSLYRRLGFRPHHAYHYWELEGGAAA